jgi:hypothetical protein
VARENLSENTRLGKTADQVAECRESSEQHRSSSGEITSNHVRSAALMDGDNEANLLDELLAQVNLRARIAFAEKCANAGPLVAAVRGDSASMRCCRESAGCVCRM